LASGQASILFMDHHQAAGWIAMFAALGLVAGSTAIVCHLRWNTP
jgi:hypothetical protein